MATLVSRAATAAAPHRSTRMVVREWRVPAVRSLPMRDLAAIESVLRAHAAASAIERRERFLRERLGTAWSPCVTEAGGSRAAALADLAPRLGCAEAVRIRTYACSASVTLSAAGLTVRVDDDEDLAAATISDIRRIVDRPLRRGLRRVAEWAVPALVLGLPVAASTLDAAGHAGRLTWEGMALSAAVLGCSLARRGRLTAPRRSAPDPEPLPTAESGARFGSGDILLPGVIRR